MSYRTCKCGEGFFPRRGNHWLCDRCWREAHPEHAIDQKTLDAAIRLCHPDAQPPERHQLAEETTKSLLAIRDRSRR